MKQRTLLLLFALTACFSVLTPRAATAGVSFSFFYDNLDPYGEWVEVGDYGYCWRPNQVERDWRPYTDGYWSFTDAGWTWVSYEDYGWITYHYGRWTRLEDIGWIWVPGYEWGPAWVSWRKSDDYIGWAPLPPAVRFRPSVGISVWVDRDYDIGPGAYSFCEYRHFGAPVLRAVIIEPRRNVIIINNSINITNITINNLDHRRVVYNGGPDYRMIAGRSDRRIETLKLERRTEGDFRRGGGSHMAHKMGNQLIVAAPDVERSEKPIAPPKVARVVAKPRIDHGWGDVSNPAERKAIQQKFRQETRGIKANTPAKPVDTQALQTVLPPKADPQGTPGGIARPSHRETPAAAQPSPATAAAQPQVQSSAEQPVAPKAEPTPQSKRRVVERPAAPQAEPTTTAAPAAQPESQIEQPAAPKAERTPRGQRRLERPAAPQTEPTATTVPAAQPESRPESRIEQPTTPKVERTPRGQRRLERPAAPQTEPTAQPQRQIEQQVAPKRERAPQPERRLERPAAPIERTPRPERRFEQPPPPQVERAPQPQRQIERPAAPRIERAPQRERRAEQPSAPTSQETPPVKGGKKKKGKDD